ncbi:MAG: insulinase family protein [Bacteroidales bacterium]|nr:insulinase family protein [Bacteroidales bacterium]
MKKLIKSGLMLMAAIFMAAGQVSAQAPGEMPQLPVDSAVRVGTLPNGLTYYIRHNETPKGQADFYIAQKVGSILEEDNQRGLAHFLEHMCFNGTENFPGKGIINWLESVGVKFGLNLNAYTSVDETVYNISAVPVARKSVQDSCLLILHDWASALTLDPAEIDAERGVIHEEWRRSNVGTMRILEQLLPEVYPGNKYGMRLPIGTMEVVDNFPPQAIIDYYHTWYRPDQQGIIVVGDIDPDYIEAKIKEIFTPIKMPENAKERYYVEVEDTPGTIVAVGKDVEQSAPMSFILFKFDHPVTRENRNTQMYYAVKYMTDMISAMLNARLSDIANKPDSPFAQAEIDISDFFLSKTKAALGAQVIGKGQDITPAIQAVYREIQRAVQGGFTEGEYERATAELRSRYQQLYDSRNNTPTENYSREYVRAFVDNEPIPGIDFEKQIIDVLSYNIPLQAINQMLPEIVTEDNRVIIVMMPDAEGYVIPTDEMITTAIEAVDEEELEPYRDEVKTEPLIPALPAPGKIVSERHLDTWDATELTLGNGIKVVVKPTQFKDNEIVMMARAKGGLSTTSDDVAASVLFLPYSMNNHGLGDYTNSDLKKYLQGKQVSVDLQFDTYDRMMQGTTTIQDLPTLMELVYANFTEFNITEDEFAAACNMMSAALGNQESTPDFQFAKLVMSTLFNAPAKQMISIDAIGKADRQATLDIVKSMLANPADYTFYFVGNIDMATFKPLVEQYIATLPVNGKSVEYAYNPAFEITVGPKTVKESMAMQTPQTWVCYNIDGEIPFTAENRAMASMIAQVMSKRLLNKVREEMGATYSIGAVGQLDRFDRNNFVVQIPFPMKPEMQDQVFAAIDEIIAAMANDITDEELNPVKEFMVKEATENLEENSAWAGAMSAVDANGVQTFLNEAEVVNAITTADLMKFWKSILDLNSRQTVILAPAE